jgi:phosphoenolpyruvate carboxykinase (GTP)
VLAWVCQRVAGSAEATETPIGWVPSRDALQTDGLGVSDDDLRTLLSVDAEEWRAEVPSIREHFAKLGDRLPQELHDELEKLEQRLT